MGANESEAKLTILDCPYRASRIRVRSPRALPSATMVQAVGLIIRRRLKAAHYSRTAEIPLFDHYLKK